MVIPPGHWHALLPRAPGAPPFLALLLALSAHAAHDHPRSACYATMAANEPYVRGVRVLHFSLRQTGSFQVGKGMRAPEFVVLDLGMRPESRRLLSEDGATVVEVGPSERVQPSPRRAERFSDRFAGQAAYMSFTKLVVFRLPFDRVVYLDADMIVLRSLRPLIEAPPLGRTVLAAPERPDLRREFNAGLLALDPSAEVFRALVAHVDDEPYACGHRASDQSFLCHFFATVAPGRLEVLPRSFNVLLKAASREADAGGAALRAAHVLHYNGRKPWKTPVRRKPVSRAAEAHARALWFAAERCLNTTGVPRPPRADQGVSSWGALGASAGSPLWPDCPEARAIASNGTWWEHRRRHR